jgi:hypothetical protein
MVGLHSTTQENPPGSRSLKNLRALKSSPGLILTNRAMLAIRRQCRSRCQAPWLGHWFASNSALADRRCRPRCQALWLGRFASNSALADRRCRPRCQAPWLGQKVPPKVPAPWVPGTLAWSLKNLRALKSSPGLILTNRAMLAIRRQ